MCADVLEPANPILCIEEQTHVADQRVALERAPPITPLVSRHRLVVGEFLPSEGTAVFRILKILPIRSDLLLRHQFPICGGNDGTDF